MGKVDFKSLVDASRELLSRAPRAHARRLGLLALLGLAYPYLFALTCLLLCLVCAVCAFVWEHIVFAVFAGLFLGFLIRFASLVFFAIRPPEGLKVGPKDAQALFLELEALAESVGARLPHAILLDASFNAGAASLPGRWLFSPKRDYLMIGLPMMASLTPREFRSVMAHELSHFSLSHPWRRRLSWRALQTWRRVDAFYKEGSGGGFLTKLMLGSFASWYLPRLDALLSVTRRADEFDADAKAASVSGRDASVLALAVHSIQSKRLSLEVSMPFWEKARTQQTLKGGLLKDTLQFLRARRPSEEELSAFFDRARSMRCLDDDSHPSAGERIARLGYESKHPSLSATEGPDAAKTLLGDFEASALAKLEELWRAEAQPVWNSIYGQSQMARRALSDMLKLSAKDVVSIESKLHRARLLEIACGPESVIRPLEDILDESPSCVEAKFMLGHIKLALGKEGGEGLMLEAMKQMPPLIRAGFDELSQFYRSEGRADDYARLVEMRDNAPPALTLGADGAFLKTVVPPPPALNASSKLSQRSLNSAEVEEIVRVLSANANVETAYLALVAPKAGATGQEEQFHALVVVRKFSLLAYRGENDRALAAELSEPLSKHTSVKVVPMEDCPFSIRLRLKLLKDALIYKA